MSTRPNCPKCGKPMQRGSKAQSGRLRWRCIKEEGGQRILCYQTTDPSKPPRKASAVEPTVQFFQEIERETLVITWAQNATPIHEGFLRALEGYCKRNKAQLLVMPGRYRNPTSIWSNKSESEQWWDERVEPYLLNQRTKLNENLMLIADVNVRPTAIEPLSGFESLTHGESGILPHPKLQMECIATPSHRYPKIMTTTGAITTRNYTDSKEGKKGDFHHVFGALVVERDRDIFHLRHINARADGAFCELDRAYYPDGSSRNCGPYQALVFGDAHPDFADPRVVSATFGRGGLVDRLNPTTLVYHDLMDSYAVNPHHAGNPFIKAAKQDSGKNDVAAETARTIRWAIDMTGKRHGVVVPSNHDNMLARWILNEDWKEQDSVNMDFYLETALFMKRGTQMTATGTYTPDPFIYHVRKRNADNLTCLEPGAPFSIAEIDLHLHGDKGPKGARGSRKNLSKIGSKTIIGHSHSPGIREGCYQTGTMTYLGLEYTGPVGDWLNAHVSIDPFGKRHHHICIDGKFWK